MSTQSSSDVWRQRPQYGAQSYWEERYESPVHCDWYGGFEGALRDVIHRNIPRTSRILQLGVGTSLLQTQMVGHGYQDITSVDYSSSAIQWQSSVHSHIPQLTFAVADCRDLHMFEDASFDAVLEKGTMDAMMSSDTGAADVNRMLSEVDRVLRPGGTFMLITYGVPSFRLSFLQAALPWSISVFAIAREALDPLPQSVMDAMFPGDAQEEEEPVSADDEEEEEDEEDEDEDEEPSASSTSGDSIASEEHSSEGGGPAAEANPSPHLEGAAVPMPMCNGSYSPQNSPRNSGMDPSLARDGVPTSRKSGEDPLEMPVQTARKSGADPLNRQTGRARKSGADPLARPVRWARKSAADPLNRPVQTARKSGADPLNWPVQTARKSAADPATGQALYAQAAGPEQSQEGADSMSTGSDSSNGNPQLLGPFVVGDDDDMQELNSLFNTEEVGSDDFHFAYVCTKPPSPQPAS